MIQLRMHLKGEAERAISGLGTKGIMYSTALKSLKKQFGQPSVMVRAEVNKLTKDLKKQKKSSQRIITGHRQPFSSHAPSQLKCRC